MNKIFFKCVFLLLSIFIIMGCCDNTTKVDEQALDYINPNGVWLIHITNDSTDEVQKVGLNLNGRSLTFVFSNSEITYEGDMHPSSRERNFYGLRYEGNGRYDMNITFDDTYHYGWGYEDYFQNNADSKPLWTKSFLIFRF